MTHEAWVRLIAAAVGFIVAAMAMMVLVWRDSRPRHDDWRSIVRRVDSHPTQPHRRSNQTRSFEHRHFDVREHEDEREP